MLSLIRTNIGIGCSRTDQLAERKGGAVPDFRKIDARDWARQAMRGVANVIIPSYSADLDALNERGIRHDIRLDIEYGFAGALLVSEVAITLDEYRNFCDWSVDEAADELLLIHHASFNTLEENIRAARIAGSCGVQLALLSYPAAFYPENSQEVYDYTRAFCDATDMAVMLFPVPLWGFDRIHPSDLDATLIRRLIDDVPNIVAIKAEGGMPSINGFIECYRLFNKEVVVTCPLEGDMIPLAQLVPIQFSGTSNTEYYGPMIPRIFGLLQEQKYDEASKLYWQIHPARRANAAASTYLAQTQFINRMIWKYQGWLNGFNGGSLRRPTMRISDAVMSQLRSGLTRSKLSPTADPDRAFFAGRNPG
jgi:4-hydroxy-tetrahydrodipicolinate synthase